MRYPTISAFLLATTLQATMSAPTRMDSPTEAVGHVSSRRLFDELDTPTREELSALDADEAAPRDLGTSSAPGAAPAPGAIPKLVLRRVDSDGRSTSEAANSPALSDADLASILAVSGGSSVYERSIAEEEGEEGQSAAAGEGSWASRRRRSLSAWAKRACRPTFAGQDSKYRTFNGCEKRDAEEPGQQVRSLISDKRTDEGAVKEQYYSQEAKRGVAGWVSRRRARSNASA